MDSIFIKEDNLMTITLKDTKLHYDINNSVINAALKMHLKDGAFLVNTTYKEFSEMLDGTPNSLNTLEMCVKFGIPINWQDLKIEVNTQTWKLLSEIDNEKFLEYARKQYNCIKGLPEDIISVILKPTLCSLSTCVQAYIRSENRFLIIEYLEVSCPILDIKEALITMRSCRDKTKYDFILNRIILPYM